MDDLTIRQETALQISKASSKIATAEQLADLRAAKLADGRNAFPRYREGGDNERLSWLNKQYFGLSLISHIGIDPVTIKVDITTLDDEIMSDSYLRELTLVEMQEAFRKGLNGEYGEYFGLSSVSLLKFLKGFLRSEKKAAASAIFHKRMAKAEQEANERFYKKLYEAQKAGKIELPDFSHMRINGQQAKKVYTSEESAAHRERVRQQAEAILKQANQGSNGTKEEP